jgi:hypothetical protein
MTRALICLCGKFGGFCVGQENFAGAWYHLAAALTILDTYSSHSSNNDSTTTEKEDDSEIEAVRY